MKKTIYFLVFFLVSAQVAAQNGGIMFTVKSSSDPEGLPGAVVQLKNASDSSAHIGQVTDLDGKVRFNGLPEGEYELTINFIGYVAFSKEVQVNQQMTDLGSIMLEENTLVMGEIEIVGQALFGKQMGDTTQFNASSFKTTLNANAEDLLKKMPGIAVEDGKLQAQGEEITRILVNGKPFFEGDVESALKNLPAEIIDKIQIFDKKSDAAEFSGFDDGEETKAINILIKPNKRIGQFGQASVGYGSNERYLAGASINIFNPNNRITVSGLSNNINTSRYATGETPGSGLRGNSDGNKTVTKTGFNYNGNWGKKVEISGSYSYDQSKDISNQLRRREYFSDSAQIYTEENSETGNTTRQEMNMRMEYDVNKNNEIIVKSELSVRKNQNFSSLLANTSTANGPINRSENETSSNESGLDWKNEVHYRHRFNKKGRTFSSSLEVQSSGSDGTAYRKSDNIFYNNEDPRKTLNQFSTAHDSELGWQAETSYTEPISDNARVQIEYDINYNAGNSDKRSYNEGDIEGHYVQLDTILSNTFSSNYLVQEVELGYQYNSTKVKIEVETAYQNADLKNDQFFPSAYNLGRNFSSILPSAELEYRFSDAKNLSIDYRTRTNAPSLGQLQDVIDNSNPLQLTMGNANLRQAYQNIFALEYKSFDMETSKMISARIKGSITHNTISSSVLFATDKPVQINDEVTLEPGTQLTRPVNLPKSNWNISTGLSYSLPIAFIKSNLSLSTGAGYRKRPGLVNNIVNFSHSGNFRLRVSISSNISEKIDFSFSTQSSMSVVNSTQQPQRNTKFFNQSSRFKGDFTFWKGLSFRTVLNHQLNTGLSDGYDKSYLLWNVSLSKSLFENKRGELSLTINDLLAQNSNVSRDITQLYIEEQHSNVLKQFFMLSFTYSIRHFKK